MDIKKENAILKKKKRVLATVKAFIELDGNVSDVELAKRLGNLGITTSSSTVGRDLTTNLEEVYIYDNYSKTRIKQLTDEQAELINKIKMKRKENLELAKSIGGKNSVTKNEPVKDELGHFKGSKSRG